MECTVQVKLVLEEPVNKVEDASSFEVAIFDKNGDMNDDPFGWQGREDIDNLIKKLS